MRSAAAAAQRHRQGGQQRRRGGAVKHHLQRGQRREEGGARVCCHVSTKCLHFRRECQRSRPRARRQLVCRLVQQHVPGPLRRQRR
jgi:hypothetical protein